METSKKPSQNIDTYIAAFPTEVQKRLRQVRATIKKAAPHAEEAISYGIPTFKLEGNLVHFAGYKHHVGFYPTSSGITAFKKELSAYKSSRGAVQFPHDRPVPYDLISRITKFRVKENLQKTMAKEQVKKRGKS